MTEPQPHIYAVTHEVDGTWVPHTEAPSNRWAFKTLDPAAARAHSDRQSQPLRRALPVRVARYKFDGWAT